MNLSDLPDDVLYAIFNYLRPKDLCQLRSLSRRFYDLASKDIAWLQHAKWCGLVKGFKGQCSAMEVFRISPHWRQGLHKQYFLGREKRKQMPWICKLENRLWLSKGSSIHLFHIQPSGRLVEEKSRRLQTRVEDVTRFVVQDEKVISGSRDGSVFCWSTGGEFLFSYDKVHASDTHCVDSAGSLIVSGSRDTTCKVLRIQDRAEIKGSEVLNTFEAGERVWCLKICPNHKIFAAGLAGCLDDPPLVLWDLESGSCIAQLGLNHKRGAGLLDLRFESPHQLLTCGYDTFIRLWDLRANTCVRQWEEPFDSALYCLDTDGEDAMVVGTARHGMVRLWDKRHSEPVQMMYCKNSRSPVYSVAMDYGHLYVALDAGLTIMDFTAQFPGIDRNT